MNRGDIYYVDIPAPPGGAGREQAGYLPVIVISTDRTRNACPVVTAIPLTSKTAALRFPHTAEIGPTQQNGLSMNSVALVFQIAAIDKRRFRRQAGVLDAEDLQTIEQELRLLLELD